MKWGNKKEKQLMAKECTTLYNVEKMKTNLYK